jgi:hypothetical protein
MAETRPVRGCDICGKVDDHPRHVIGVVDGGVPSDDIVNKIIEAGADAAAIRQVLDPATTIRHMDCCAGAGCPDGSCNTIHALTKGDKTLKGNDLLKHLQTDEVSQVGADINAKRIAEAQAIADAEAAAAKGAE